MVFFFDTRHFEFLCMPPIKKSRLILLFQSQYHYSLSFLSVVLLLKKFNIIFQDRNRDRFGIFRIIQLSVNLFHIFCGCNNRYLF